MSERAQALETSVEQAPSRKPLISIVTGAYNEQDNVEELTSRIRAVMQGLPHYDYEHILIDNASTDETVARVKAIIARDDKVRLIVNVRNFGHIRSPYYAMLQARGDAIVAMASDLQDPPELIPRFVEAWESGFRLVAAINAKAEDGLFLGAARRAYYAILRKLAEVDVLDRFSGFGLYDRAIIDHMAQLNDSYPYLRGLVAELGYPCKRIPYDKPRRKAGFSSHTFLTLYDMAMLGITSHSRVPLRLATFAGFGLSLLSALVAFGYLVAKLVFWSRIPFGFAPLIIGMFFLGSVQLFFVGILGEYLGAVHVNVLKRPLVVERERINFPPRVQSEAPRSDG